MAGWEKKWRKIGTGSGDTLLTCMTATEIARHHRFLRLFTGEEPAVRAYVRRLVPVRADADDVMQEVAVVLWDKFDNFAAGGDFRAWAFGIARYEVLAWLRDKGRDRLVLDEEVVQKLAEETAADEPHLARQREALEACVAKLDPPQRDLLMEAYQPQASIQAVASRSGRTVNGFYQWLHRIRRLLLDCIRRELNRESLS
ncbi:MAG TPA: sigma-70 family RNA polymerase sigma factor [Prosthecobacter sp.]|nr:sigma-70 family RNA polymerase sigma factor [Prosthecobacter sp.]